MKKETIVISLGGSLIIPEKPDAKILSKFKDILQKNYSRYKFVIVCGGGAIARRYISALREENRSKRELAEAGIRATRMNAQFVMQMFSHKEANTVLPMNMKDVKDSLAKNSVVVCGALRFAPNSTSDSTAAKLARYLDTEFINLTNVAGLFDKNPKEHKNAKLIKEISWNEFNDLTKKIKFEHGQHFVLDQEAARIIKEEKITTYLLGPDMNNFNNLLKKKKFKGTTIAS